ncbi:MAG: glycosyltransferase family 2 protein [Acidimicrobiia bacterium]
MTHPGPRRHGRACRRRATGVALAAVAAAGARTARRGATRRENRAERDAVQARALADLGDLAPGDLAPGDLADVGDPGDLTDPGDLGDLAGRPAGLVCVVMAALDEQDSVGEVIAEIRAELADRPTRVVVVDDGSRDATAERARRAGALVVRHERNLGQGDALRTGFAAARLLGADLVVTMDADGQHRPDEIRALLGPVDAGTADYVQGSRFEGRYDDAGGGRDLGIRAFTTLLRRVGGPAVTDCTNGFRAIGAEALGRLDLREDRFSAAEILLEASHRGLRVVEVPVHIRSRASGESKKPRRLGYPLGFLATIVRVRSRQLRAGAGRPRIRRARPAAADPTRAGGRG